MAGFCKGQSIIILALLSKCLMLLQKESLHINVSPDKVGKLSFGKQLTDSLIGNVEVNTGAVASRGCRGG